jgi:serine-type D-Ala-D-Ala carboxypeptidase/endopeptidase
MRFIFAYCAVLILAVACQKQSTDDLPANVIQSIQNRIDNGVTPSIVVGVIDNKGPRYYAFGKKSLTSDSAVNEHTIYEIGSISKVFTAILLAHQSEAGKLDINDPAQKYLPSTVRVPRRGEKEITLGNLSDHTSGLPRMPDNFDPKDLSNPYADYTVEQMYAFLSGYQLPRDVGAEYEYSNLAQGLLGHILALNAGSSYEDLMISTIARPLGMNETKIVLDDNMKKNLAIGHSGGRKVSNWDIPTLAGAGGIRSSVHDMLKFLAANIGLTQTPLRSAMDKSHKTRHFKAGETRVGLAWHISKGKLGDVIWHNGGTGGYRTFVGFVKETQKGVAVFTNSTEGADDIGFKLLNPDAMLNPVKASIAPTFRNILDSLGIDEAIAHYKDAKQNQEEVYEFSERQLNALGYGYVKTNLPVALAIFKLNVEQYPESYNVYDSYGEALFESGDNTRAIENYKKSLALNPANPYALAALEKLGIAWEAPVIHVSEEILEAYTGTYEVTKGMRITVTREGNLLYGKAPGGPRAELFPKSQNEFYLKDVNAQVNFDKNEKTLTLYQNGQVMKGKKIN